MSGTCVGELTGPEQTLGAFQPRRGLSEREERARGKPFGLGLFALGSLCLVEFECVGCCFLGCFFADRLRSLGQ